MKQPRDRYIVFRVTDQERDQIEAEARTLGVTLSEAIRLRIWQETPPQLRPRADTAAA